MAKCKYFDECPFFKKYNNQINETCKILINNYCFGKKKDSCQRLLYYTEKNKMPSDNMAPNGIDLGEE